MGWRFQRRITVFPGLRLNLSRRGISTSVGPRGASLTFRKDGTCANVGIPGTGLSCRERISGPRSPQPVRRGVFFWIGLVFWLVVIVALVL